MSRAKLITVSVLALLVVVVLLQNSGSIETKLLFVTVTMPRIILLSVTLLVGFVLGLLTAGRLGGRSSDHQITKGS